MATQVTHDIRIQVRAMYAPEQSDPKAGRFLFSYRITISNQGQRAVQLLRRHWRIVDSLAETREVEGPGVVGETPVLGPGDRFTYTSFCDLHSGFGSMRGTYRMQHVDDGSLFDVVIPPFDLCCTFSAN